MQAQQCFVVLCCPEHKKLIPIFKVCSHTRASVWAVGVDDAPVELVMKTVTVSLQGVGGET